MATDNEDPPCKRAGCAHALSAHNMRRAEKRAQIQGTMVLDFPSGREDEFNIQSGTSNSSCSEKSCACLAYLSPYA
jgi:hypothetical protein